MVSKSTSGGRTTMPDPRPSGPKGLHNTSGVVQDRPDGAAQARPQAKPQPRVRQKVAKPEGPLKRQAQRKAMNEGELDLDVDGDAALDLGVGAGTTPTASQQRRAAHKLALEAGILAAARELFAERGAEALTLREVGAAVGYSHATLYSFFHDKGELLARLAEDSLRTLLTRLQGAADGAASGGEAAAVARAFVNWGLQHPHDYRLLMLDTPAALRESLIAGLDGLIAPAALPAARAAALWAGLHGLVMLEQGGLAALGGVAARARRIEALLAGLLDAR
ncbi:TetR/AcrR family transcriptional regulator [Roseateles chitinivorans]|uniref:TetR/AcrR family transcriptional regulator n=1 Tax=Roseateles chitinivorans TaxID=2917965 RepID=UPI003D67E7B2